MAYFNAAHTLIALGWRERKDLLRDAKKHRYASPEKTDKYSHLLFFLYRPIQIFYKCHYVRAIWTLQERGTCRLGLNLKYDFNNLKKIACSSSVSACLKYTPRFFEFKILCLALSDKRFSGSLLCRELCISCQGIEKKPLRLKFLYPNILLAVSLTSIYKHMRRQRFLVSVRSMIPNRHSLS